MGAGPESDLTSSSSGADDSETHPDQNNSEAGESSASDAEEQSKPAMKLLHGFGSNSSAGIIEATSSELPAYTSKDESSNEPPIGDLAEVNADSVQHQHQQKSPRGSKKRSRPARPVAEPAELSIAGYQSSDTSSESALAAAAASDGLDSSQAAVLSSIEHQLEDVQPPSRPPRKAQPKHKQVVAATSYVEPTITASSASLSFDSLPADQQRLLLSQATKSASNKVRFPQSSSYAADGLLYGQDGRPIGLPSPGGRPVPLQPQPQPHQGLSSMQIGQYKITPQTQFVQSIIEPSRQVLGQYFKQYIGQLGQLAHG